MESMKDNLNDCNIHFKPEGLVSTGLDAAHVSLAHFKLFADGVEHYECNGEYTLGINTSYFHRYLSHVSRLAGRVKLEMLLPDRLTFGVMDRSTTTNCWSFATMHLTLTT